MKKALSFIAIAILIAGPAAIRGWAHCEIPCGIYSDQAQFDIIEEHCQTIEKAMAQVNELSAAGDKNYNQIVRWVTNKEEHASKVQHLVSQYFLTQRIKPTQENYEKKVVVLQKMLVAAMKCKQTTDPANVQALRELAAEFRALYFGEAETQHLEEHHESESK